nr:reverse transcriptase domain-containing protein [Tanacetum cinerariifolium]
MSCKLDQRRKLKKNREQFSQTAHHVWMGQAQGLTSPEGVEFIYALRFQFTASNNEAEYEALVVGLRIAARMAVQNVKVSVDSKLVAIQVLGTYVAKEDNMVKYLKIGKSLVSGFTTFSISQVPRSKNKKADTLSKIVLTSFAHLSKQVLVEVLENKSIVEKEIATVIEEDGPTWMTQLVDYLKGRVLLGDKKEDRKLRLKARQYELMEGVLYRRSFFTPWLRCVGPLQAEYVMREIHEGTCSMHVGSRSVVAIAIRLGTMEGQIFNSRHRLLHEVDRSEGSGNNYWRTAIQVLGTYVAKEDNMVKYLKIGKSLVSGGEGNSNGDRGRRTDLDDTVSGLLKRKSSPWRQEGGQKAPPQGPSIRVNGGSPLQTIILYTVVKMRRTTPGGIEAKAVATITGGQVKIFVWDNIVCRFGIPVIPTEIRMPLYRTTAVDVVNNDEELRLNLDLLEERQERAAICEAKAKSKMMKYYNARVRGIAFKPGDFVYRSNDASHAVAGGKLGPK